MHDCVCGVCTCVGACVCACVMLVCRGVSLYVCICLCVVLCMRNKQHAEDVPAVECIGSGVELWALD